MKTDREKLIELIKEANLSMWGRSGISSAAERRAYLADYLISKGVTIPVRCGECRYRYEPVKCSLFVDMADGVPWFRDHGEDFFCEWGERKEDGQEA